MSPEEADNSLQIGSRTFESRLIVGSARFPNHQVMLDALEASGTQLVTVAIRRMDIEASKSTGTLELLRDNYQILPNTAGCYTARDAVLTAQLAREALDTDLIKLEVIGDDETLLPDSEELLEAARQLVEDDFEVMAYCPDDPIVCRKLESIGCAAVMPLGSPIGSGMGIRNPYNFQIIRDEIDVPMFLDAGVGTASDAVKAMELGCDGVLLNSAVARAKKPVSMAKSFRKAVQAGREAYLSGRIPTRLYADPTSPIDGAIQT